MARTGQIIPEYSYPHQKTYINDNTIRETSVGDQEYELKCMNVFVSSRGIDNQFIEKKSYTSYLSEYGTPNMELYGQPGYMPYIALKSGYTSCQCMRVMPDDAIFANAILIARVKYNNTPMYIMKKNPKYSADPAINPIKIKNPDFQQLFIHNPYKDMTVEELLDVIGNDLYMPNPDFNPTIDISDTNPLKVTNIYRIFDNGSFDDTNAPDIVVDGSTFTDGSVTSSNSVVVDGREFTNDENIFKDIEYIVNINYDADIPEYIDNPNYQEESIKALYPADNKVHVSFTVKHADFTDKAEIDGVLTSMMNVEEDSEGYIEIPIACFYSLGRGEYGNNISITISSDTQSDRSNEYKNYMFKVTASDITTTEIFNRCASYRNAKYRTSSLFYEDVINDMDRGSSMIGIYSYMDGVTALVNFINKYASTPIDEQTFDVFFGKLKGGLQMADVIYEAVRANDIDLTKNSIALAGGSDGAFALDNPDREKAINDVYIKAFSGKIDRSIMSKKRVPATYIFDANYPDEVKEVLKSLIIDESRQDMQGFIDGGILNNQSELRSWLNEQTEGSRYYSYDPFNFQIKDPFNGRRITVTTTYFLAANLAKHVSTNGLNVPFAQSRYAKITGVSSLKPVIDDNDRELKDLLYRNGINYYEAIGENSFMRSTQQTSQKMISDLSAESNMRVVLAIKGRLETLGESLLYGFSEAENRKLYTNAGLRIIDEYRNYLSDRDLRFEQTEYEEEYNILHCYVELIFKNIVERIINEIDIQPRV